jgi:hypothetical protein
MKWLSKSQTSQNSERSVSHKSDILHHVESDHLDHMIIILKISCKLYSAIFIGNKLRNNMIWCHWGSVKHPKSCLILCIIIILWNLSDSIKNFNTFMWSRQENTHDVIAFILMKKDAILSWILQFCASLNLKDQNKKDSLDRSSMDLNGHIKAKIYTNGTNTCNDFSKCQVNESKSMTWIHAALVFCIRSL